MRRLSWIICLGGTVAFGLFSAGSAWAGAADGLTFTSPDGSVTARVGGRVRTHYFAYQQGSKQIGDISVVRARLYAEGTIWERFRFKIENDFTSSSGLRDAYLVILASPYAVIEVGQFKVPFSMEALYSHRYIDLIGRPAVVQSTVNPSRDIGAMVYGKVVGKTIQYQLGIINGSGQNTHDRNDDKDGVARLIVSPFDRTDNRWISRLSIGGAMTYGNEPFTTTASSISGLTPPGYTFYSPLTVNGIRQRLNGQLSWFGGPFSVKGEYIRTREQRQGIVVNMVGDLSDFITDGWYATATWVLTGEDETPDKSRPSSPLFPGGGLGLWKAAIRYEEYALDTANAHAPSEPRPNGLRAWTFGLSWCPVSDVRVSADYQREAFSDPARSPRPGYRDESVFMSRAQVEF